MTTETGTITLGGETYQIRAFPIDRLEWVLGKLAELKDKPPGAALKIAHELIVEASGDQVKKGTPIRASLPEVFMAVAEIIKVTGLDQLGETMAQVRSITGSSTSSPTSAPKRAGRPAKSAG